MNILSFMGLFLISLPTFLVLDLVWLGFVAKDLYQAKLGHLLGPVNWAAAGIFYGLFLIGLTFFATYPALQARSVEMAIIRGALFGFFCYMTYDLTNLATLKDWPLSVTVLDMMWGAFVGAVAAGVAVMLYTEFS